MTTKKEYTKQYNKTDQFKKSYNKYINSTKGKEAKSRANKKYYNKLKRGEKIEQ